jgi:stringent starvation protein B
MSAAPAEEGKWSKLRSWGAKSAKTATTAASKGLVKAKTSARMKLGGEPTPEEPATAKALDRLRQTKTEVVELAKASRGMYEGLLASIRFQQEFHKAACSVRVDTGDQFAFFARQIGQGMMYLDTSLQQYLQLLLENVVEPLEKFRDDNIEGVNKMKWDYTNFKSEYDYAFGQAKKASEKPDTTSEKQAELNGKRDSKKGELDVKRAELIAQVNALELAKQSTLFKPMEVYWSRFVDLHNGMSATLSGVKIKEVDTSLMTMLHAQDPPESLSGSADLSSEHTAGGGLPPPKPRGGGLPPPTFYDEPEEPEAVEVDPMMGAPPAEAPAEYHSADVPSMEEDTPPPDAFADYRDYDPSAETYAAGYEETNPFGS